MSAMTLLQLFSSSPSSQCTVSAFAFAPTLSSIRASSSVQSPQLKQKRRDQSLLFAHHHHDHHHHHHHDPNRGIEIVESTSSSSSFKTTTKKSSSSRRSLHQELFTAYHAYKDVQSTLDEFQISHTPLNEQAAFLQMNAEELDSILSNGYNARQALILDNIALVHHVVQKIQVKNSAVHLNLSKEDLVQEGTIGLLRAIDKFDPSLGYAFSTYAVHWIRATVTRSIQSKEEMIRVPEYLEKAIRLINTVVREDETLYYGGKVTDIARVMELTGLTQSVIKEAAKVKYRRMVQANPRAEYTEHEEYWSGSKNAQFQQQQQMASATSEILREGQLDHFKNVLGQYLSMKEIEAISWRYGLLQSEQNENENEKQITTEQNPKPEPEHEHEPLLTTSTVARDYEAEAEEALFGPQTIFSSKASAVAVPVTVTAKRAPKASVTVTKGGRWGEAMSFKEVGDHMRVSAEYGRRLCSSAMKKLQAAAEEGRLDPAMLF